MEIQRILRKIKCGAVKPKNLDELVLRLKGIGGELNEKIIPLKLPKWKIKTKEEYRKTGNYKWIQFLDLDKQEIPAKLQHIELDETPIRQIATETEKEFIEKIKPLTYCEWIQVIQQNFPQIVFEAEACASVIAQMKIQDIGNPFGLVLIGPPSSAKTTCLNLFTESKYSYKSDYFTPSSFVSHHAKFKKEKLEEVDLLPRIKNKAFIVPDLGSIFGMKQEDLLRNLAILTRLFDGEGLTIDSAVHGRRGYGGATMFTMLSGSTPLPHRVWKIMGTLGARLFFLQVKGKEKPSRDEYIKQLKSEAYRTRLEICQNATERFLLHLFEIQHPEPVEWNREEDPNEVLDVIVQLAQPLARLRGTINVVAYEYESEEGKTKEVSHYSTPIIENPDRASLLLYNLARGHALIQGRTQLTKQDLPLLIEVVLSSAPQDRVQAFEYLLQKKAAISAAELQRALNCSRDTAYRTMKTLDILRLATLTQIEEHGATENIISIKPDLEWFQTEEFQKLRHQILVKLENFEG